MLQSLGRPEVHMALDVMIVSGSGQQHEGCLLLTSEVLFVVSISEDTQQQAFPVTEIDCLEDDQQKDLLKVQLKQQRVPSDLEVKIWVRFSFRDEVTLMMVLLAMGILTFGLGGQRPKCQTRRPAPHSWVCCPLDERDVSLPFYSLIDCDISCLRQKFSEGKSRGSLCSWSAPPLFWKGSHSYICTRCLLFAKPCAYEVPAKAVPFILLGILLTVQWCWCSFQHQFLSCLF